MLMVKNVVLKDNWQTITGRSDYRNAAYGQAYDYTLKDNKGVSYSSSGVASYEPTVGGDENPFRQPVFCEEKHLLAPDDEHDVETPLGVAIFPGPSGGQRP